MSERERLAAGLERLIVLVRRLAPPGDISLSSALTLSRLVQDGPRRLTELAAAEQLTQPAMTQLVTRLERDGLVVRGSDPADRRVVLVRATEAGEQLLARRRRIRAATLAAIIDRLDPAEQAALSAALPAIERLSLIDIPEQ